MVISFSVKEAREQLLNEGIVFTFRWKRRKFFYDLKGDIEHTWANSKRGGKRIAYVDIEEAGQIDHSIKNLELYFPYSGFKSLDEWQGKIMFMMPYPGHDDGWLYKVTLQNMGETEA